MRAMMMSLIAMLAGGAAYAQMALTLPLGADDTVIAAKYHCEDGGDLQVQYITSGANNLAMMTIEGQDLLFVNVVSASGARYMSGMWEWWAKGHDAILSHSRAEPVACQGVPE